MTKKEQAEMQALRNELALVKALRFTEAEGPDVAIPEHHEGLRAGFLFNSYQGVRVEPACTTSVSHTFGRSDRTTSQRPCRLYSTRLRALRAGRVELERACASLLAGVDRQIENEIANQGRIEEAMSSHGR